MTTMLIANNCTRDSGSFMGDQCCMVKTAYLFVQNQPDVDRVLMTVSPSNEMAFLWTKFIETYNVELLYDSFDPGDWGTRHDAWNKWRSDRSVDGVQFDYYRELYLRIHGGQRQHAICGSERGLGRRNIYEYWLAGQEGRPDSFPGADWFDDTLIHHPPLKPTRDVYISPHCKTQGNVTFTFDYWAAVVHRLIDAGVSVTVGYNWYFCEDLVGHPLYRKHWGDHKQWMDEVCRHKVVTCGNTGTGWLAAACGVPLLTMEPPNSQMPDHRYRECGLRNLIGVMDTPDADYCTRRLIEEINRCVVMTTGCYDVLHSGHIRHLQKSRALGTKLIVAMNSDASVRKLKGPTRPVNSESQRKAVLEALRCVDEVVLFDGPDATDLIGRMRPDVLTNGFGYTLDRIVGRSIIEAYGGRAVVTCHGDAKDEPSTTKVLRRMTRTGDVLELCRVASLSSVNGFDKLRFLAETFLRVVDLPGDVADLGAYRGGTSFVLRRTAPDKRLHLFDTWAGTPFDDELCHHRKGEWAAELEECRALVGSDELTFYRQGVFPYTAGDLSGTQFCFVYIDPDTYRTVHDAIEFFWPRLATGGVLVFDDYGWSACAGVKKAVDEVFDASQLTVVEPLYACVVEKR
jgi:rfaE bifunctional protein nucleotidyltransferase chain/domain